MSPIEMNKFFGIHKGRKIEANLKEWCELTNQSYDTIKRRYSRNMKSCPFKKSTRVDFYRQYAFYRAINLKQSWDDLVLYSLKDFNERVFWLIKEYLPEGTKHDEFTSRETIRLQDNLDSGLPLGLSLKLMLQENDVKFLEALRADYVRDDDPNKESLDMLALRFGQSPQLVRKRIKNKWGLNKALTTVNY